MSIPHPESTAEVKEYIERSRAALFDVVENLPPDIRDEKRDRAGWSTKDHVIHLVPWERSMVFLLTGRLRHDGLGVPEDVYRSHDVDAINDEIFRQHRDRSWQSVRSEFDAVNAEMMALLDTLSWDDLHLSYSHYAPNEPGEGPDYPVGYYVAGNTYGHFDQHRRWIEELVGRDS